MRSSSNTTHDQFVRQRLKYAVSINDQALPENTDLEYEIQYIDIGNVNSEGQVDQIATYRFKDAPSRARRCVQHGDVILSTVRTYLQAIAPIENPPDNLIVSTGFAVLRPRVGVLDASFCKYAVRESNFIWDVITRSVGVSYPAINASDLGNISIPLPSHEVQHSIASYLDRETAHLDSLIAAKENLLVLLAEKRKALITRAVTRGLDPNVELKDSGIAWLGKIPRHWEVKKLKYVASIQYGVGDELDRSLLEGVPLISLPNVDINGNLNLTDLGWANLSEIDKKDMLLNRGDLLFNWRNGSSEHLGKTAYFDVDGEYTHVGFLLRIRFNSSKYLSRYFQHYLNALRITGFFLYSRAMVNNTFNQTELENLHILVPKFDEQKSIVDYIENEISKLDSLREATDRTISLLRERRAAVITAAVTGKMSIFENEMD